MRRRHIHAWDNHQHYLNIGLQSDRQVQSSKKRNVPVLSQDKSWNTQSFTIDLDDFLDTKKHSNGKWMAASKTYKTVGLL